MTDADGGEGTLAALARELTARIRDVPDFPRPGIVFKDITPVLLDPPLMRRVMRGLAAPFATAGITHVIGIESRGFIFGAPVALELGAAFIPARKQGKLPASRVTEAYELEYGQDVIEMHRDALDATGRVLVVDDVIATGGTMAATCRLAEQLGAQVQGVAAVLELSFLPWRPKLEGRRVHCLLSI
jgi:adenine phosphoribosyltransferase